MLSMKFGSMLSTQPYLDPCLGMSRTFGADLRKAVLLDLSNMGKS